MTEYKAVCARDALIAEKVMGAYWTERKNVCRILWNAEGAEMIMEEWYEKDWVPSISPLPEYSTQIADAWLVVEKLRKLALHFNLQNDFAGTWFAEFFQQGFHYGVIADTAPLAICLAALKAVEDK